MKIKLSLLLAMNALWVGQSFSWDVEVYSWAPKPAKVTVKWAACRTDQKVMDPGTIWRIDGKACLLTAVEVEGGTPYTSSGQRKYDKFYIIGPVNGQLMAGRIEEIPNVENPQLLRLMQ